MVGDGLQEESSTASEAGSDSSMGRGLVQFATVFDVPPWHTEDKPLEALAPAASQLTSATGLIWTRGSLVLAAWKVQGASLEAALLEDSHSGTQLG